MLCSAELSTRYLESNLRIAHYFKTLLFIGSSLTIQISDQNQTCSRHVISCSNSGTASVSEPKIIDMFADHQNDRLVVFLVYKHGKESSHKIVELRRKKSSSDVTSDSSSFYANSNGGLYDMQEIDIGHFFCEDFVDIMKMARIVSHSWSQLEPEKQSSAVIVLTVTNHVVHFVNGSMISCVNLTETVSQAAGLLPLNAEEWRSAVASILHFPAGIIPGKGATAVLVNSECFLIDWLLEKVTKTWSCVDSMHSCDLRQNGNPCLVLLSASGRSRHHLDSEEGNKSFFPASTRLEDVDVTVYSFDQSGGYGTDAGHSVSSRDDQSSNVPECVRKALLGRQKQSECLLREATAELARKENFLSETIQWLSQLQAADDCYDDFDAMTSALSPLVSLCRGSLPEFDPGHEHRKSLTRLKTREREETIVTDDTWMKTVGNVLIVGITAKNLGKRTARDSQITLIPSEVTSASGAILECSSANTFQSLPPSVYSSSDSKMKSTHGHTDISRQYHCSPHTDLEPGESRILTSSVDLTQLGSGLDPAFLVLIGYELCVESEGNGGVPESSDITGGNGHGHGDDLKQSQRIQHSCGQITLQSQDYFNCSFEVGRPCADLSLQDIVALDTIQIHKTLDVISMVSSVGDKFTSKLNACSLLIHLRWAQQYIFLPETATSSENSAGPMEKEDANDRDVSICVTKHPFLLCRLKLLEQTSRYQIKIQIFALTNHQCLMFIKFLYSILPDDVTILAHHAHPADFYRHLSSQLISDVQTRVDDLRQQMSSMDVERPSLGSPLYEESRLCDRNACLEQDKEEERTIAPNSSPKFYSKKLSGKQTKAPVVSVVNLCEEESQVFMSGARPSLENKGRKNVSRGEMDVGSEQERKGVRKAKKRLKDRLEEKTDA